MFTELWNTLVSQPFVLAGGTVLGFFVGMLTGLFGAGGGFIITPALNIFLGLPMNIAVGTSSCQVLGASTFSLYHHFDRRWYGIRVAICMGFGIPLGSFIGSKLVGGMVAFGNIVINGRELEAVNFLLMAIFVVFLSFIAGWLLFDNFVLRRGKPDHDDGHVGLFAALRIPPMIKFRTIPIGDFSTTILFLLGVIVGFLGGLLGVGGGVIMMPMLFYVVGQTTKYAANTSTMLVFLTGLFAAVNHAAAGNINYPLVAVLVAGAFFGAKTGAGIQRKISAKSIRKYFGFVVLGAVVMVLVKLVGMIFF